MLNSPPDAPPTRLRVRLRKITAYEVHTEAGQVLGVFDQVGALEGIVKLVERTPKHMGSGTLVVDLPSGFAVGSVLNEILDQPGDFANVLKASIQYVEKLAAAPAEGGGK
jgi:hypothetical protein